MTDAALDFSIEAMTPTAAEMAPQPEDKWLRRRARAFGASDVPVLMLASGLRDGLDCPKYIKERARITNRTHGVARIFAEKAGLVAPAKAGAAAAKGTARE